MLSELRRATWRSAASLFRAALEAPGIRALREANAARQFQRPDAPGNPFYGVFRSFEEAKAAIPYRTSGSYDTTDAGALYRERLDRVFPHDYPMLFWMKPLIPQARRVFDLGGHVGIANYAYEPYLGDLSGVEWTVCDLPSIVEAGRKLAASRGRRGLSFTSRYEDANGADVFIESGALQYLPHRFLVDLLARLPLPPRDLLVNLLPTTDEPTFFTLNNIRTGICPYQVVNEAEFISALSELGYRRVDSWSTPEKKCVISLHPRLTVDAYRGFYFRRDSGSSLPPPGTPASARLGG